MFAEGYLNRLRMYTKKRIEIQRSFGILEIIMEIRFNAFLTFNKNKKIENRIRY